jgi:hypothetical protein
VAIEGFRHNLNHCLQQQLLLLKEPLLLRQHLMHNGIPGIRHKHCRSSSSGSVRTFRLLLLLLLLLLPLLQPLWRTQPLPSRARNSSGDIPSRGSRTEA